MQDCDLASAGWDSRALASGRKRFCARGFESLLVYPGPVRSNILRQAWLCCSPPSPSKPSPSSPCTALILQLWRLRRERRHYVFTHGPDSAPDWPLQEHLRTTASSLTLLCKQNKQLRIQQLLQGAEEVAHNWLTSVYQVVRKLVPKATPKPIQFRDAAGAPLITAQEAQMIGDYFTDLVKSYANLLLTSMKSLMRSCSPLKEKLCHPGYLQRLATSSASLVTCCHSCC